MHVVQAKIIKIHNKVILLQERVERELTEYEDIENANEVQVLLAERIIFHQLEATLTAAVRNTSTFTDCFRP